VWRIAGRWAGCQVPEVDFIYLPVTHIDDISCRIEQFMSLSLAAEPKRKGIFEPYYWNKTSQAFSSSLIPLLVPDPLPTMTLVDRTQILRGRVDSDASEIHYLQAVDGHLRVTVSPKRPQPGGPTLRDSVGMSSSQGGTLIPVHGGDLVVMVVSKSSGTDSATSSRPSSRVPSRPPSSVVDIQMNTGSGTEGMTPGMGKTPGRTPSIRVKPGSSPSLDRKSSIARRNSLPPLSNSRSPINVISEFPTSSSEPPLRVVVQAGTINCLVDTLVNGLPNVSVSVADDNGEMSLTLREGMGRELVLDRGEFARVWWMVFRSYLTPLVFFELLRKIYISHQTTTGITAPGTTTLLPTDIVQIAVAKARVLETVTDWISQGGGAQDILDDTSLLHSIKDFLRSTTLFTLPEFSDAMERDRSVQQACKALSEAWVFLRETVKTYTMKPATINGTKIKDVMSLSLPGAVNGMGAKKPGKVSSRDPPNIDSVEPMELVENLDEMAFAVFATVTDDVSVLFLNFVESLEDSNGICCRISSPHPTSSKFKPQTE
jgi:GTPase-activating protein BEM2